MISLLLAIALSAAPEVDQVCTETKIVCVTRPACATPKKIVKKRKPVVAPLKPQVIEKEVIREIVKEKRVVVKELVPCGDECSNPTVIVGLRGALGGGLRDSNTEALLGLRFHIPSVRLGLDLATSFQHGTGLALLVYPYQGEKLNWHVNAGVLGTGNTLLSVQDVPRTWDLTLGSGLEYRVLCNLSVTFDWRWAIPSPVFVAEHGWAQFANGNQVLGPDGRYLDVKQVFGNSFTQSHFMLGLMLRN